MFISCKTSLIFFIVSKEFERGMVNKIRRKIEGLRIDRETGYKELVEYGIALKTTAPYTAKIGPSSNLRVKFSLQRNFQNSYQRKQLAPRWIIFWMLREELDNPVVPVHLSHNPDNRCLRRQYVALLLADAVKNEITSFITPMLFLTGIICENLDSGRFKAWTFQCIDAFLCPSAPAAFRLESIPEQSSNAAIQRKTLFFQFP